jgi:maintenance of mitochondrial morphology protein 1
MNALVAFFLGQLSLALLIFAFIKFFIFGEAPPSNGTRRRPSQPLLRASALRHKPSSLLRPAPPIAPSTILSKTFYNVSGHQPESLDWFNVLVAQTLAHLRAEALHDNAILKTATEVLNGPQKPDFLGEITVTEISLGEEFPIFSNCRIIPVDEAGVAVKSVGQGTRLLARLDVDLSDAITLGIESKLVLNYPKPLVAVLPVALAVSVVRFSGTVRKQFQQKYFKKWLTKVVALYIIHSSRSSLSRWGTSRYGSIRIRKRPYIRRAWPHDLSIFFPPRL